MAKANYKQIAKFLEELKPFEGNSMSAYELRPYGKAKHEIFYIVKSYDTEIAAVRLSTGEKFISTTKHSVTTSKQQNKVRAAFKDYTEVPYRELRDIIYV